jgi:hypothetical protein
MEEAQEQRILVATAARSRQGYAMMAAQYPHGHGSRRQYAESERTRLLAFSSNAPFACISHGKLGMPALPFVSC